MSQATRISFREVKDALVDRIDALAQQLFSDGYHSAGKKYWMFRNPRRDDRSAGSAWIWLTGPKAGGWCDAASGDKGDVFQLIQLARGGDALDAKKWGQWWAGLDPDEPPAAREKRLIEIDERRRQAEVQAALDLARDRRRAHGTWLHGIPLATKDGRRNPDAALAFRYLENRGIDLSLLPRLPGCTRLLLDQRHAESGERFAALGSIVIGADHRPLALHRVFITAGAEKIGHKPARKTWPDHAGGFIPIWDGGTGLSAKKQSERGELTGTIACEGIEDGFAAAIGKPDHRVRAALSLGNLKNLPIFACDDRLVVWRDNDWGKPAAEAQLQRAVAELADRGRATGTGIYVTSSQIGKDANDLLLGRDVNQQPREEGP